LTDLEQPVMRRVLEQIIEHLPDSWNQVMPTYPRFEHLEINPQFMHLVAPPGNGGGDPPRGDHGVGVGAPQSLHSF